jgi:hypothetical protein
MGQPYLLPPRLQLVQTTAPYLMESWPSLVLRLGQCNRYDPMTQVGTLMQTILDGHNLQDTVWWPSSAATIEILATLSHIAPHALRNTFFPSTVAVYPHTHVQYCPACVAAAPFHRRIWMAQLVVACVEHGCLLLHQCPTCEQPVSVADVLKVTCSRCKTVLTDAEVLEIEDCQRLDAQRVVQAILTQTVSTDAIGSLIPKVPGDTLIVLIHHVAKMLHFATNPQYHHRFDVEQHWKVYDWSMDAHHERLHVTVQATQLLYDWPFRFYAFLDLQYAQSEIVSRVAQDKAAAVVELTLRASQLQLIREDYHTYLGRTYISQWYVSERRERCILTYGLSICYHRPKPFASADSFTTLEQAARQLRVTPPVILHLIRVYSIPYYELYLRVFVLQDAIDTIQQTWDNVLTLSETAQWFGVPSSTVEEMTQQGILTGVRVVGRGHHPQWAYRKHDVARWIERIWAALAFEPRRNIGRPLYLTPAAHLMAELGITETTVLWKLVEGELPGFIDDHQPPEFASISFSHWDLHAWGWELHDQLAITNHWVSTTYFIDWLNDPTRRILSDIASWIDAKLIQVVNRIDGVRYFDRIEAERFIRTYTYPAQAAVLLNLSEEEVLQLIAQGKLATVPCVRASFYHHHLLLRADVERLQG